MAGAVWRRCRICSSFSGGIGSRNSNIYNRLPVVSTNLIVDSARAIIPIACLKICFRSIMNRSIGKAIIY